MPPPHVLEQTLQSPQFDHLQSTVELKLVKHIKIVIEYYLIHLDIPVSGPSAVVVRMVSVDPVAVVVIGVRVV